MFACTCYSTGPCIIAYLIQFVRKTICERNGVKIWYDLSPIWSFGEAMLNIVLPNDNKKTTIAWHITRTHAGELHMHVREAH